MLKSLTLINFQRVKKRTIVFDRYVTVLVGGNDLGKTSTLRGLRWICLNRPIGKGFINWDATKCTGILKVDNHIIKRVVGKTVNEYYLDGEKLKAFRTTVPDEVANVLRISELNFHRQLESAFWFTMSAGQVTKELNKLVDLSSIDALQAHLAKELRDTKLLHKAAKERVESVRTESNSLRWIVRIAASFRHLPPLAGDIARKSHTMGRIASKLAGAVRIAPTRRRLLAASVDATATATAGRGSRRAGLRGESLRAIVGRLRAASGGISGAVPVLPDRSGDKLGKILADAKLLAIKIEACNCKIRKQKASIEDKLGGRCPTCGNFLSDKTFI